jgi:hypothetical protein
MNLLSVLSVVDRALPRIDDTIARLGVQINDELTRQRPPAVGLPIDAPPAAPSPDPWTVRMTGDDGEPF